MTVVPEPALLPAIPFEAPPVNPAAIGLYPLVDWQTDNDPEGGNPNASRFLGEGIYIRHHNYGGAASFGVWDAPWCGEVERIVVSGTGGTWTYTWDGNPTGALAFNITAANLQTAIDALPGVGAGGSFVTSPSAGEYLVAHITRADSSVDGASLTGPSAGANTQPVIKSGYRPADSDPFSPMTVWAADQCDMTVYGQEQVLARAQQNLRLLEQVAVERDFSMRLLADVNGVTASRDTLASGIAYLESLFAETNTVGIIHANPAWASVGVQSGGLWVRSGNTIRTQLGHAVAFGGGYVDGLGDTLVATSSPVFGWRDDVQVRTTVHYQTNEFIAVAERNVALAYEEIIGAVTVTTAP